MPKNKQFIIQHEGFTVERISAAISGNTALRLPLMETMKPGWYWVITARDAFDGPFKSPDKAENAGKTAIKALESGRQTTAPEPTGADDAPPVMRNMPVLNKSALSDLHRLVGNKRSAPATELSIVQWLATRCETMPVSAFKQGMLKSHTNDVLITHEHLVLHIESHPDAERKLCVAALRRTHKGKYKLVRAFNASTAHHAAHMFDAMVRELSGFHYMMAPQEG